MPPCSTSYPIVDNNANILGLTWRFLEEADLSAVASLAAECQKTDGGLPLMATEAFLRERYWNTEPRATLGAFADTGQLIAYTALQRENRSQEVRITTIGQVHPQYRRQGIGTFLMQWMQEQASILLAEPPSDLPHILSIPTESLTADAERLYQQYHFEQVFGEKVMRFDLRSPLPEFHLPESLSCETWADGRAALFFEAYQASFRERPGFPGWSTEQWIEWATDDETFQPDKSFLVRDNTFPVGFILCSENYVAQIGVRPEYRQQGIATALLSATLSLLQNGGQTEALLTVAENNPTATGVYLKFGFEIIGRRARFEKREIPAASV
jgi:mycothiol synthase